jgi:hypothetical protein
MFDKAAYDRAYRKAHRKQISAYQRAWYHQNKRSHKNTQLRTRFGIGLREYEELLRKQNGVCVICTETDPKSSLAVDHDHVTGKIRGLLCRRCNFLLGRIEHERGQATIKYLQERG